MTNQPGSTILTTAELEGTDSITDYAWIDTDNFQFTADIDAATGALSNPQVVPEASYVTVTVDVVGEEHQDCAPEMEILDEPPP